MVTISPEPESTQSNPTPSGRVVMLSPLLHSHPGAWRLKSRGVGCWLMSVCWLSRNGRVETFPRSIVREFEATPKTLRSLFREGFWVDEGDEIYVPQWVANRINGRELQLWKFGPLDTSRPRIPLALREAVYLRDGLACLHCASTENLSLDHIHPFSLGGKDTLENLQTLCRSCNSRKGARV